MNTRPNLACQALTLAYLWILSAQAADNPCAKSWKWDWKTTPDLQISAPTVADNCIGQITVGPAIVTATSGVKWQIDINECPQPPSTTNETTVPISPTNSWFLYSCPLGTSPTSGTGTNATFTTTHAGWVVVQFETHAAVSSPPWDSGLLSARTAPLGVGPEITQPDASPSTIDDHFSFSYNSGLAWPNGTCEITPTAICAGSPEKWLDWSFLDISGCLKSMNGNGWPYEQPTLIYTRLPNGNSDFGNKTITATRKPDNCQHSRTVQLFFPSSDDAVNHPGTGTGFSPDWYCYWQQTSAGVAGVRYADADMWGPGYTEMDPPPGTIWRGYQTPSSNDSCTVPSFGGPFSGQTLTGIELFAWVGRHESMEASCENQWGYPRQGLHPEDYDQDGIPDWREPGLSGLPGGPFYPGDPDSDNDGIEDWHEYLYWNQSPFSSGSFNSEDWSVGGRQWYN